MNTFPNPQSAQYAYLHTEDLYLILGMFLTVGAIYGIVYLALKIVSKTFLAVTFTFTCSECRKEMHEDWMSKREDYLSN